MRSAGRLFALAIAWVLVTAAALSPAAEGEVSAPDLSGVDLSGDWYVLIHYKDDDSADKSITKFLDLAWSIEQTANTMTWEEFPYVMFSGDTDLYRRHAMKEHLPWEPDESGWKRIRESFGVSSRAMKRKRLTGSVGEGYESLPPLTTGGFNTMTFTQSWRVRFAKERIRIEIVDSLGGVGFEEMEGATVYEITERKAPDELRGRYDRDTRHGTFRMVRSKEREVVK
jgi:hypothetical protein